MIILKLFSVSEIFTSDPFDRAIFIAKQFPLEFLTALVGAIRKRRFPIFGEKCPPYSILYGRLSLKDAPPQKSERGVFRMAHHR